MTADDELCELLQEGLQDCRVAFDAKNFTALDMHLATVGAVMSEHEQSNCNPDCAFNQELQASREERRTWAEAVRSSKTQHHSAGALPQLGNSLHSP